jgi:hypothetical protein
VWRRRDRRWRSADGNQHRDGHRRAGFDRIAGTELVTESGTDDTAPVADRSGDGAVRRPGPAGADPGRHLGRRSPRGGLRPSGFRVRGVARLPGRVPVRDRLRRIGRAGRPRRRRLHPGGLQPRPGSRRGSVHPVIATGPAGRGRLRDAGVVRAQRRFRGYVSVALGLDERSASTSNISGWQMVTTWSTSTPRDHRAVRTGLSLTANTEPEHCVLLRRLPSPTAPRWRRSCRWTPGC